MKVRVAARITVPLADMGDAWPAVKAALTIANPAHAAATSAGRWAGDIAAEIRGYEVRDGVVLLPRGFGPRLRELAPALEYDWTGLQRGERVDLAASVAPIGYQGRCVDALVAGYQGMLVVPCGGGKTVIALLAVSFLGRSTLILVHTLDLVRQWRDEVREKLGYEAGMIGDGAEDVRPVTVATMQTVAAWPAAKRREVCGQFGVVVVDEGHHAPCESYGAILADCPAMHRWGLTATPDREDGLTPLLGWLFGAVLETVTPDELQACGRRVAVRVERVDTGWAYEPWERADAALAEAKGTSREAWAKRRRDKLFASMLTAAAEDMERNRLILDIARADARAGHSVLVLSGRVEHCLHLAAALELDGIAAAPLTGRTAKKKRATVLDAFKAGDLSVLCATQLADEGLDVPRLDRVLVALPQRSARAATQRIGRAMRPEPGKDPVLYDFVDDVGVLRGQWFVRLRAYRDAGCR